VSKPKLLDLFCCAGGAGMGYYRAGFDVVGVDINPQPNYPFFFIQGDALEFAAKYGHKFDAIHASPPCQANIPITAGNRGRDGWEDDHVNLIPKTRGLLSRIGRPYVIENGVTKELRADLTLCGLMFGLPTFRHRLFELGNWAAEQPPMPSHKGYRTAGWRHGVKYEGNVYGVYGSGGGKPTIAQAQEALGIDWTNVRAELNEAIPPAYTEYVGRQLMAHLTGEAAA
jgi:hypothetical protein